jgi:hypothetical protein
LVAQANLCFIHIYACNKKDSPNFGTSEKAGWAGLCSLETRWSIEYHNTFANLKLLYDPDSHPAFIAAEESVLALLARRCCTAVSSPLPEKGPFVSVAFLIPAHL